MCPHMLLHIHQHIHTHTNTHTHTPKAAIIILTCKHAHIHTISIHAYMAAIVILEHRAPVQLDKTSADIALSNLSTEI